MPDAIRFLTRFPTRLLTRFLTPLRRLFHIAGVLCACTLAALSTAAHGDTLGVGVAANLQYVFADLQAAFEKQSPHRLQASFASSGKLVSQITLGAPFDLFLSADMQFPDALQKAGFSATRPEVYARGELVLWSARKRDLASWQTLLTTPAINRIALANPETAPYGREALRALQSYGLDTRLKDKLVYAESVSQVNQYVQSGTVDAGFTSKSVVLSAALRDTGSWIAVPENTYRPIDQGVVITRYGAATHPQAAQAFLDFLHSAPARTILAAGGYQVP